MLHRVKRCMPLELKQPRRRRLLKCGGAMNPIRDFLEAAKILDLPPRVPFKIQSVSTRESTRTAVDVDKKAGGLDHATSQALRPTSVKSPVVA